MNIKNFLANGSHEIKILLLCFISFTFFLRLNYGNLAIILALCYNIFFFKKENLRKIKTIVVIVPFILFLSTIFSSLYSKDYLNGLKRTDLELLVFLISIITINYKVDKFLIVKIFTWFYYSSIICTGILLINLLLRFYSGELLENLIFHNFTAFYDQHPVYFGMFLSLSLFSNVVLDKKKKSTIYLFLNCILFLGIVFCASKILLVFNVLFYLFFYWFKIKKLKLRLLYLITIPFLALLTFQITFVNKRFKEGLEFSSEKFRFEPTNDFLKKKTFTYDEKRKISDLELRYIFGKLTLYHLIQDRKILLGYGQGDTQKCLDYYYMSYGLAPNWFEGFNVHNQYLHILVTYGIIVLFLFLLYLFYSLCIALKHNDILYLFFLSMTLIVFIFEVILVRNKGIIFFYFFNTLFLFKHINFENRNIRNKRDT